MKERNLNIGIIMLILILVIAIISVTTILIYKEVNDNYNITKDDTSKEQKEQIEEENEDIIASESKSIYIEGKKYNISIQCQESQNGEYYNNQYKASINGKNIEFSKKEKAYFRNFEILTIKASDLRGEYILLKIETQNDAEFINKLYYIVSKDAEKIGEIYIRGFRAWKNDADYDEGMFDTREKSDKIIAYEYTLSKDKTETIEQSEYVINGGEIEKRVQYTYNESEFSTTILTKEIYEE